MVVLVENGAVPRFDAEVNLYGLDLPDDAQVFVEAYYKASYMRFGFGTVGQIHPPQNRRLADVASANVLFRLKVVDRAAEVGRILAKADGIHPQAPGSPPTQKLPILHVDFLDLGQEVWRLRFEDAIPVLEVNEIIDDIRDIVRADSRFFSLVWPAVVREVLTKIVVLDQHEPVDDSEDWRDFWLRYVRMFYSQQPPDCQSDMDTKLGWIESAITAFCQWKRVRETFVQSLQEVAS